MLFVSMKPGWNVMINNLECDSSPCCSYVWTDKRINSCFICLCLCGLFVLFLRRAHILKRMRRNAQQPAAHCSLVQRGDDLYHSSHSFPSDNPQGESDGGLLNKIRKGRDESSRMHAGVRDEYEY